MPDNNRTQLLVARRVPAAVAARAAAEFNAYVTDADMDAP
ncbi:TPA: D-glycerate dehydrogenase, partial [Burkholderia cepacia]|nr:D-glycerate dehydrogenase [Burkholderia cepacia]